jgi:hypothetical protein
MLDLTPVLIMAIVFGFVYGIVSLGVKKKERITMIEKGMDPSGTNPARPLNFLSIRYGLLLIGVAAGILLGNILKATTCLEKEVSYFSMVFLFGGLALVISYFLEKRHSGKQ